MSTPEFLTSKPQGFGTAVPAGVVFVIRCEPDPFTGERINIGVCVQDANGRRYVRCIDEPGRLQCLYGTSAASIVSMAKMAAACAGQGLPSPSSQIIFDTPQPYYNASAKETLAYTFQEQVTVALPQRQSNERMQVNDAAALSLVVEELSKRFTSQLLGEIVANTPTTLLPTQWGMRPVTIHLQPSNGVGVIRSADYTPAHLKNHLMDSVLDIQCAAKYRKSGKQAIFLLRPNQESEKLLTQRDESIDNVMCRANDIDLHQSGNAPELAENIIEWATS